MADPIDSAARVVSPVLSELWESNITNWGPEARDIVRALAEAGLLVTPEHDAEVRAAVLAELTEVYIVAWDGEPIMTGTARRLSVGTDMDLDRARAAVDLISNSSSLNKPGLRIERRLVTPWERVEGEDDGRDS